MKEIIKNKYLEVLEQTGNREKLESIKRRSPLGHLATVEDVAGTVSYLLER